MISQVIRRVVAVEETFFERKIPGTGQALVSVGERVEPADILARYEASSGQRLVKLAAVLKVSGHHVHKYLTKKVGDRIYQGEIIAQKKGLLGIGKKIVTSPADGIFDALLPDGSMMIKFLPVPRKLAAAVAGVVKTVINNTITIQTEVAKIYGFAGAGMLREGTIRIIAKPNEFILPSQINPSHQGEILVGGATIARATVEKAVTLGIKGIVVGGMNYRDYLSLGNQSDVGITILLTEGFGVRPMGGDVYNFLLDKVDSFSFISGREKQIIFPLLKKATITPQNYLSWRMVKIEDRVNVLFSSHDISLGVVKELTEDKNLVLVKLDSGTEIEVPSTNVQIID